MTTTHEQLKLPGIDWSKYDQQVPTPQEIDDGLMPDIFYLAVSDALYHSYGVRVSAAQLKISDAIARRDLARKEAAGG